ncbi:MAG: hypothetical protein GY801_19910, partial [bacterium]|nr:hypothetical protein [bacterium]
MKQFYFWTAYSIIALGVFSIVTTSASGGSDPEVSIEASHIRAIVRDALVEVALPLNVNFTTKESALYDVDISIEDLQGKTLGSSSMPVEISRDMTEIEMLINAGVEQDKLAVYVVHYSLSKDKERIEGRKSLFYAVRQIETQVLMQRQFYAASRAALRIVVKDPGLQKTVEGANVGISLDGTNLFQGRTDAQGTLDAHFTLPEDVTGDREFTVTVELDGAKDVIKQAVHIKDMYKILLTTDKPLYQPGQIIHIRSLALKKPDLRPAGEQEMTIEVEDSKGNKVFKQAQRTNRFGVSSADFQLAQELNEGSYRIRAVFGQNTQEKNVTVERYVLPKYNVLLDTDKRYYQPGDVLKGELQSDYFFGKPVSGGTVIVNLSKFDTAFEKFAELKGTTDENGHYQFETQLPDHFVGRPLEQGNAFVKVDVVVTDTAEHEESKTLTRSIAADLLNIVVIPESGTIVPGVENIFYVAASYPDGSPAEVTLKANFNRQKPVSLKSDASGIGELRATPRKQHLNLSIVAKD